MWAFGGFDGLGFACNVAQRFEVKVTGWTKVSVESEKHKKKKKSGRELLSAEQVEGRYHHTAVVKGHTMLVFGGLGDGGKVMSNDVLEFHFVQRTWKRLITKGEA